MTTGRINQVSSRKLNHHCKTAVQLRNINRVNARKIAQCSKVETLRRRILNSHERLILQDLQNSTTLVVSPRYNLIKR